MGLAFFSAESGFSDDRCDDSDDEPGEQILRGGPRRRTRKVKKIINFSNSFNVFYNFYGSPFDLIRKVQGHQLQIQNQSNQRTQSFQNRKQSPPPPRNSELRHQRPPMQPRKI